MLTNEGVNLRASDAKTDHLYRNVFESQFPTMSVPELSSKLTFRAAFLNWFIAWNCLSLLSTVLSRGVSGASPSSLIQGWSAGENKVRDCTGYSIMHHQRHTIF